jgi:hypothetical protein
MPLMQYSIVFLAKEETLLEKIVRDLEMLLHFQKYKLGIPIFMYFLVTFKW